MSTTVVSTNNVVAVVSDVPTVTVGPLAGLGVIAQVINVKTDYGAKGDGVTDDLAAFNKAKAALATTPNNGKGGFLYIPPGVYLLSGTFTWDVQCGVLGGLGVGGTASYGSVTLQAGSGLTGPILTVSVGSGQEGWRIQNLKLDGNNVSGVTAALNIADNTATNGALLNITTANTPTGLLTGDNIQSITFTECYFNHSHTTGANLTTNNRALRFVNCVIGGTTVGAYIGPDDAVSRNAAADIVFVGGECYAQGSSTASAIIIRNSTAPTFLGTWFENAGSGTLSSVVQVGTATATATRAFIQGRFQGNSKATYLIEVVNANRPVLQGYGVGGITSDVLLTSTTSRAVILGLGCPDPTGSALLLSPQDGLLRVQGLGVNTRAWTSSASLISDGVLRVDATAGSKTVPLLAASSCKNQLLAIVKTDSGSNTVTIDPNGSDTINGASTYILRSANEFVWAQSDGTSNWVVLGAGTPLGT